MEEEVITQAEYYDRLNRGIKYEGYVQGMGHSFTNVMFGSDYTDEYLRRVQANIRREINPQNCRQTYHVLSHMNSTNDAILHSMETNNPFLLDDHNLFDNQSVEKKDSSLSSSTTNNARQTWVNIGKGLQYGSYAFDFLGGITTIFAFFTEGAAYPVAKMFFLTGTVLGYASDICNTVVVVYYDENLAGGLVTLTITVGVGFLFAKCPKTFQKQMVKEAERRAAKIKLSFEEYKKIVVEIGSEAKKYKSTIGKELKKADDQFDVLIGFIGAGFDKAFDQMNNYIPEVLK